MKYLAALFIFLLLVFSFLSVLAGVFGWSEYLKPENRGSTGDWIFRNPRKRSTRFFYILLGSFFCVGLLSEFIFHSKSMTFSIVIYLATLFTSIALIYAVSIKKK